MLAHDCFYNFLPVPIMKLFTKYESNYTTILTKEIDLFVTKTKHRSSWQVHLLQSRISTEFSWQSYEKASLQTLLNAERHGNSLVYVQNCLKFHSIDGLWNYV